MLAILQAKTGECMYAQAAVHHKRMEQAQVARLASADSAVPHQPRWFERVPGPGKIGEEYIFRYRGGYWETRAAGAFAELTLPELT